MIYGKVCTGCGITIIADSFSSMVHNYREHQEKECQGRHTEAQGVNWT